MGRTSMGRSAMSLSHELLITVDEPMDALLECAKHNIPGPVFAGDVGDACIHVLWHPDDEYEAEELLYSWYECGTTLMSVEAIYGES